MATRYTDEVEQRTRHFLAQLERAERVGTQQPVEKSIKDFAALAVPQYPHARRQDPAAWAVDRNEYVNHFKGTSFIAIGAIAKKVAQQDAYVYRRVPDNKNAYIDEPVEYTHELNRLLREVNQIHTQFDLWYQMVAWRLMTGDSYWWKARNGFGKPAELWPLPSQWTWAIPSSEKYIGEYLVRGVFGGEVYIPVEDVLHIREPSIDWGGTRQFYGRPIAFAGATAIDLEEQMFKRLYHQFKNFSPPGLHYATEEELSEEQFIDMMVQIRTQHTKSEQTGEPIITHSGMKVSEFSQSVREMDYSNSLQSVMDYLLAIYSTPKAVVGLAKDFNRANVVGATLSWIENTINPLLIHLGQHLTHGLASEFGDDLVIKFEPCSVSDRDSLRRDVELALKAGAITPNEVREVMLEYGEFVTGGDRALVPNAVTEVEMGNTSEPFEDPEDEAEPDDEAGPPPDVSGEGEDNGELDGPEDDSLDDGGEGSEKRLKDAASEVVARFFRSRRKQATVRSQEGPGRDVAADPQATRARVRRRSLPVPAKAEAGGSETVQRLDGAVQRHRISTR